MNWQDLKTKLIRCLQDANENLFVNTIGALQNVGADEKDTEDGLLDVYLKTKLLDIAITSIKNSYASLDTFAKICVQRVFNDDLDGELLINGDTSRQKFAASSQDDQKMIARRLIPDEDFLARNISLQKQIRSFHERYTANKAQFISAEKLTVRRCDAPLTLDMPQEDSDDYDIDDFQYGESIGTTNANNCYAYMMQAEKKDETRIVIGHFSEDLQTHYDADKNELTNQGFRVTRGYIAGGTISTLKYSLDMLCNNNYLELTDPHCAVSGEDVTSLFYDFTDDTFCYNVVPSDEVPVPYSDSESSDEEEDSQDEQSSESDTDESENENEQSDDAPKEEKTEEITDASSVSSKRKPPAILAPKPLAPLDIKKFAQETDDYEEEEKLRAHKKGRVS